MKFKNDLDRVDILVICIIAFLLLLVGLAAWSHEFHQPINTAPAKHQATPTPTPTPELSDKDKIGLLRAEAHKRGLRWHIFCTDWMSDPNWQFQGQVISPGSEFGVYIEDGAVKPSWIEHGATQADTAYALYQSIQQSPNTETLHNPQLANHKKMCPPELRGE